MARKNNKCIKVIPLGGIGEIGKNMTAIEYEDEVIIIDAGIAFPTDETPGVDMIIPDITYITENKHKIKAIFVTHGHEDHIGAMPFVLKEINVPVYGSKLTIAFIEYKLNEHNLSTKNLTEITDKDIIQVGKIKVEFVKVSHSISGAIALVITTPIGIIYHSGDFKIDYTPIAGDMIDLAKIAQIGSRGVLLMMADSTNVEREGFTISERNVGASFDRLFSVNSKNRIIIATFSSNIHRLQQILDAASNHDRKVVLSGRSLIKNSEIATRIGELKYNSDLVISIDQMNKYPENKIVIISTGSQGEPMSALTRMAKGEFNKVKIQESDTIILSSSPIPGNERAVYSVINNLYRKGANVVYESIEDIHVSGHACKEELKLLHSLIKPSYFVPVHGEYRHLKLHTELAQSMGMAAKNTLIPALGEIIEVRKTSIKHNGKVKSGTTFIDGITVGETDEMILSDRKKMSGDGIMIILAELAEDKKSNTIDIIARGLMITEELTNSIKEQVKSTINSFNYNGIDDRNGLKTALRRTVKKGIWNKLNKAPMIIPIIMEN